jgi:Domain of unknown function (DUF4384)/Papain family cysteine protease
MKKWLHLLLTLCFAQTVFTQTYSTGLSFDDALHAKIPVRKRATNRGGTLPAKVSLKQYCPTPQNQGEYSNCVGWAVGYAACTISEAIISEALTDKRLNINAIDAISTSPTYVYTRIKPKNDKDCNSKAAMEQVLTELKGSVLPRYREFSEACLSPDAALKTFSTGVRIENFVSLFQPSDSKKQRLYAIKQTLANKKPVVIGIWHYKSFEQAKKVWSGNLSKYSGSGHAVCLTGYDDTFEGGVGAVEVMNSWGTNWGESGFSKIRYKDLDTILKYAFEITLDGCETIRQTPTPLILKKDTFLNASIQLKLIPDTTDMPLLLNLPKRSSKPLSVHFQSAKPYPSGTKYQVLMDHSEPIYLYVLSSDLTGQLELLFPAHETMSPFLTNPNAPFTLPNEEWYIESDERVGKDYLIFLASKTELRITDWLNKWNEQPASALDKIRLSFSSKIQAFQSLNLLQNKILFQAKLEMNKIILLVVEMGHE